MTLNRQASFPIKRSFVLKLHRDATGERDQLAGRLENLCSGHQSTFRNAEELLALLSAAVDESQLTQPTQYTESA